MVSASRGIGGSGGIAYLHCEVKCFEHVVVASISTPRRLVPSDATNDVTHYVAYGPLHTSCRTVSCSYKLSVQNRVEVLHEACSVCAVPSKTITPAFFLYFLIYFSTPGCSMLNA